jgi:hypothetical protein
MKSPKNFLLIIFLTFAGQLYADEIKNYVGLQYKRPISTSRSLELQKLSDKPSIELPKECKSGPYFEKISAAHPYGLTFVTCNNHTLGWLEEFVDSKENDSKTVEVKIVDQILIRQKKEGEAFSSDIGRSEGGCYLKNDKKSVTVMGLYGTGFDDKKNNIVSEKKTIKNGGLHEIWVINPNNKKIEPAPKKWLELLICKATIG